MKSCRELKIGSQIFVDFIQSAEVENTQLKAEVVRCLSSEGEGYLVAAKFNDVNDRFLMDILQWSMDLNKKKNRRDTLDRGRFVI